MKLNLKWISDKISDEYKKWKCGDIVLLQAQTGTGKTNFIKTKLIDHMEDYQTMLYVCNRTYLKRQLKIDLLKKYNKPIPRDKEKGNVIDWDKIDNITKINNIVITSYHAIQYSVLEEQYKGEKYDLESYDYIILDECHYILADGNFNNKCRLAYKRLIKSYSSSTIKIFISGTMEEIEQPVVNSLNSLLGKKPQVHKYNTGTDYRYCNVKYFEETETIVNLIRNDKTDEKWLIFVTKLEDAYYLEDKLSDNCSIIKSGTKSEELDTIVNESKFNKKVLICTKAMDNGINIADDKLTNIVVMAWDKVTFIQELGRKRVNIDDAQTINLYIPKRYKKSFTTKRMNSSDLLRLIDLLDNDENEFNKRFDNDLEKIGQVNQLFYRDNITGKWKVNLIGRVRLLKDMKFYKEMEKRFKNDEFAFIKQQLEWLELEDTFDESNMIENIPSIEDSLRLEQYLNNIEGQRLYSDQQQKISDLIIEELTTISKNVDYRTKKLKPSTIENIIRSQLNLKFAVSNIKREDKVIDGKRVIKNYFIITRIKN